MLDEKFNDALQAPGYGVEFDPDEATQAGAFTENALTEEEARDSAIDLLALLPLENVTQQGE